jgi:hypothetical protein
MPRTTIAIRGLNEELYWQAFSLAKRQGRRVADVMNEALKNYIENLTQNSSEGSNPKIENAGTITMNKSVILNLHKEIGKFTIENSGKLFFERDIDKEALDCIKQIINSSSGTVRVPRSIYHMVILKTRNHGLLEMY